MSVFFIAYNWSFLILCVRAFSSLIRSPLASSFKLQWSCSHSYSFPTPCNCRFCSRCLGVVSVTAIDICHSLLVSGMFLTVWERLLTTARGFLIPSIWCLSSLSRAQWGSANVRHHLLGDRTDFPECEGLRVSFYYIPSSWSHLLCTSLLLLHCLWQADGLPWSESWRRMPLLCYSLLITVSAGLGAGPGHLHTFSQNSPFLDRYASSSIPTTLEVGVVTDDGTEAWRAWVTLLWVHLLRLCLPPPSPEVLMGWCPQ